MGYTNDGIGYQRRDTSLEAALSNVNRKLSIRQKAHDLLAKSKRPLTTDEMAVELQVPYVSLQPRISELCNEGLVKDSGERGKTDYGKQCIKWMTADAPPSSGGRMPRQSKD